MLFISIFVLDKINIKIFYYGKNYFAIDWCFGFVRFNQAFYKHQKR